MNRQRGALRGHGAVMILLTLTMAASAVAAEDGCADSVALWEDTVVRLAADRIDGMLDAVADSTKALGEAYARLSTADDQSPPESGPWLARRTTQGHTAGFRTWPAALTGPPAFQAP